MSTPADRPADDGAADDYPTVTGDDDHRNEAGEDRDFGDDGDDGDDGDAAPTMPSTWEQMGGLTGVLDSAIPVVVFVVANAIGGLGVAIGCAIGAAVLIAVLRLTRSEPIGQALGGLFGVAIAAFIAYRTGSAKGYFLFGIWSYVVYGGALLASIVVRWPLIGLIWENLNGRGNAWRGERRMVLRYDLATLLWVLVCVARFVVQRWLYDTDQVGWLAVARIAMGYPLFIVVVIGTVLIVTSGSGLTLGEQWRRLRDKRRTDGPRKAMTFRERYEIAKAQQERRLSDKHRQQSEPTD